MIEKIMKLIEELKKIEIIKKIIKSFAYAIYNPDNPIGYCKHLIISIHPNDKQYIKENFKELKNFMENKKYL